MNNIITYVYVQLLHLLNTCTAVEIQLQVYTNTAVGKKTQDNLSVRNKPEG